MARKKDISKKEKELLNILGKNAYLSYKDILALTDYKRENVISKRIRKLREMDFLRGPYYDINLDVMGTNQLYNIYADITYDPKDRDLLFTILRSILGVVWIFPVQQEDKFFTHFQCNHYSLMSRLLKLLQKKRLIEYWMAVSRNRWLKANPDFFGPPVPNARTLLTPCELPDLSYPCIKSGTEWSTADLLFMQYLQVDTDVKTKIRDTEYKQYGRLWRYSQIQHSIRKIKASGIIQSKDFHISPYPRNKCCTFILLLEALRKKSLLRVLHNFGKGCRIYKSCTTAGNYGFVFCWASTRIMPELVALFDAVDDVTVKAVYYLRTHTGKYLYASSFEYELFNIERQRWEFPYLKVKREIEEFIKKKR